MALRFLSSRAENAHPEDKPDEDRRIRSLTQDLKDHSPWRLPLSYTICELYDVELSPLTFVTHESTLNVAGRGSKSPKEFVADCCMTLENVGGFAYVLHGVGKVHKGILNAFAMQVRGVLGLVDQVVAQGHPDGEQGGEENLVFFGYSLGRALAPLLGLAYAQRRSRATNGL